MKAIVNRAIFEAVAATVCAAITRMELSETKLEAYDDRMVISAAGQEMFVRASVPAKIERSGAVAVKLRYLTNLIATKADPIFTLEVRDAKIALRIGQLKWNLSASDAATYPERTLPEVQKFHQIDPANFAKLAAQVLPVVRVQSKLYDYALLSIEHGAIKMVATNGCDLVEVFGAEPDLRCELPQTATITKKSLMGLAQISKRAAADGQPFALGFADGYVLVRAAEYVGGGSLVQTEFPDYRSKLSKEHSLKITVARASLLEVLTLVERTLVPEKGHQAEVWFEGGRLMFRVVGGNDFEADVEAQAEGEPLPAFKFNVEGLQKIVSGTGEVEAVTLAFNPGPRSPLQVFCREEPGYWALTMPMMSETVSP